MAFDVPSIDTLLQQLLADYSGQVDRDGNAIDVTKGSTTFIDSSVLASALQGIYYRLKYTEQQALSNLPGAKTATIDKWASIFGITRGSTDTDADVVQNIITRIQQPPAGGNENDWLTWAKEIVTVHENDDGTIFAEPVIDAIVVENARRPGSVDLYLKTNWSAFPLWSVAVSYKIGDYVRYTWDIEEKIFICLLDHSGHTPGGFINTYWDEFAGASIAVVAAVQANIESNRRVLGIWDTEYHPAGIVAVYVTAVVTGGVDASDAEETIAAYIESSKINQVISLSKITTLLDELGAETVTITDPADNIVLAGGQKAVAGTISVTVA